MKTFLHIFIAVTFFPIFMTLLISIIYLFPKVVFIFIGFMGLIASTGIGFMVVDIIFDKEYIDIFLKKLI